MKKDDMTWEVKTKTKLFGLVFIGYGMLLSLPVQAELSSHFYAISKYLFRGIPQSGGNPAIQGVVDYQWDNGSYVGSWASIVEGGQKRDVEIDVYAGHILKLKYAVVDLGFQYYGYHHVLSNKSKQEVYSGFYLGPWAVKFHLDIEDDEVLYTRLQRDFTAPWDTQLRIALGHQLNKERTLEDYSDFLVRIQKEVMDGLVAGIDYTDTLGRDNTVDYLSVFIKIDFI